MILLQLVHSGLARSLNTASVRIAMRVLASVILFCVGLGAVRGADAASVQPTGVGAGDRGPVADAAREEKAPTGGSAETLPADEDPAAELPAPTAASTPEPPGSVSKSPLADRVGALMDVGTRFWLRGDRESAERTFADALSLDAPLETKRELLLRMVQLYENSHDKLRAIAVLEKFLNAYPHDQEHSQLMMRLGLLYREIGAYAAATGRFYQVLNATMRESAANLDERRRLATKARLEIADTFLMQGKIEEARKYYSLLQLLDLEPADRERVQFREGQLQHELRLWQQAEKSLGAFLETYPRSVFAAEARYLRAKALKELGRKDEAMEEVIALLREQDDTSDPALARRVAYWKRRTGNELANTFYQQGDFLGALAIYQALARASDDPSWRWPAVYQVGLCFERLNLPERAMEAYQVILDPEEGLSAGMDLSDTLVSLQGMAKWRLEHLEWRHGFEEKLESVTAGKPAGA